MFNALRTRRSKTASSQCKSLNLATKSTTLTYLYRQASKTNNFIRTRPANLGRWRTNTTTSLGSLRISMVSFKKPIQILLETPKSSQSYRSSNTRRTWAFSARIPSLLKTQLSLWGMARRLQSSSYSQASVEMSSSSTKSQQVHTVTQSSKTTTLTCASKFSTRGRMLIAVSCHERRPKVVSRTESTHLPTSST